MLKRHDLYCLIKHNNGTMYDRTVGIQNVSVDLTFSWCSCSWAFDLVGQEKCEVVVQHWIEASCGWGTSWGTFLGVTWGEDPSNIYVAGASCRFIKLEGFISSDYWLCGRKNKQLCLRSLHIGTKCITSGLSDVLVLSRQSAAPRDGEPVAEGFAFCQGPISLHGC